MALTTGQWQEAAKLARSTATMAKTLAKALASRHGKRWNFVEFLGPQKAESKGIVDILAIRKNGRVPTIVGLRRLDLFEIILIQVKGGSAKSPTQDDIVRLQIVASLYNASEIVLFEWTEEKHVGWSKLSRKGEWEQSTAAEIFGG